MLNERQQYAFNAYQQGLDLIITGEAGSGKSYTVDTIYRDACARGITVVKTGSSGVSVVNIQGDGTFHSMFGLGIGAQPKYNSTIDAEALRIINSAKNPKGGPAKKLRHAISSRKCLIVVDEVAMLDALTLWMGMQVATHHISNIQWVLCGDPMQLPNISGSWFWKDIKVDGKFYNVVKDHNFKIIHLNEVVRQKGDTSFIEALNYARVGRLHPLIVERYKAKDAPDDALHIYFNNSYVMKRNQEVGERLKAKGNESQLFVGELVGCDERASWLKDIYPIEVEMELVLKQRFMLRRNGNYTVLNPGDEASGKKFLSNGSVGTIVDFTEVRDEDTGKVSGLGITLLLDTGEEILIPPIEIEGPEDAQGRSSGMLIQLPGHPANSVTCHKCQGLTINTPIIINSWQDIKGQIAPISTPAWMYVAMSRVTNKNLLFFDNEEGGSGLRQLQSSIRHSKEAQEWIESTRS